MKRCVFGMFVLALALGLNLRAGANSVTISLPDIGTFGDYDFNTADTFTGNGFLGIYPNDNNGPGSPAFGHLFGLEYYGEADSETELQASLAGLSGATITSASLNFSLNDGTSGSESVKVTSFTTTGTLGFNITPPNSLGFVTGTGIQGGANSIDITSLVSAALLNNQTWLGLYLTPEGPGLNFLYTLTDNELRADAAGVRIVINYNANSASVPDGFSSICLLGIGLCFLCFAASRLKLQTVG